MQVFTGDGKAGLGKNPGRHRCHRRSASVDQPQPSDSVARALVGPQL